MAGLRTFLIPAILLFSYAVCGQMVVAPVAGTGYSGFAGDGGNALKAELNSPVGICLDAAGNLYVADFSNQRIRKVDAVTHKISTIAGKGDGSGAFAGDGGQAADARLNHPLRVCVDQHDHLFILDFENRRIRMVDLLSGIITTVAGNGTRNYVNGGVAVNSGLIPLGIATDQAGHLFISQPETDPATSTTILISKLDLATGFISTIYGNGQPGDIIDFFGSPPGLICDAAGTLYVPTGYSRDVVVIDPGTGTVVRTYPNIGYSIDAALDGAGHLIVPDMTGSVITRVDLVTGGSTVIAGTGVAGSGPECVDPITASIDYPMGVAVGPDGNVYYSSFGNQKVRKIYVSPGKIPINVSASLNPSCAGTPVTFDAQFVNPGNPIGIYRWLVNGTEEGSNASTYTPAVLNDGDIVTCLFTPTGGDICEAGISDLAAQVLPALAPVIDISTPLSTLCGVHTATFTADVKEGGDHPTYQWTLNGNPAGSNSSSYAATGLADKDVIQCKVTVDPAASCIVRPDASSTPLQIKIIEAPAPSVTVNASSESVCPGETVLFTATTQDAGTGFDYQWTLNGGKVGDNSNTYQDAQPHDGDIVYCLLTGVQTACATGQPVVSDPKTITVKKAPDIRLPFTDTTIFPGQQIVLLADIQGSVRSRQWSPADELIDATALTPQTAPMTRALTTFRLSVTSVDDCSTYKDVVVRVFYKLSLPGSFTPNGDGNNDVFRIPPFVPIQLEELSVYDRWGNKVFSTQHADTGWNGTSNGRACPTGTYVYVIRGRTIRGSVFTKGTVILLR